MDALVNFIYNRQLRTIASAVIQFTSVKLSIISFHDVIFGGFSPMKWIMKARLSVFKPCQTAEHLIGDHTAMTAGRKHIQRTTFSNSLRLEIECAHMTAKNVSPAPAGTSVARQLLEQVD